MWEADGFLSSFLNVVEKKYLFGLFFKSSVQIEPYIVNLLPTSQAKEKQCSRMKKIEKNKALKGAW